MGLKVWGAGNWSVEWFELCVDREAERLKLRTEKIGGEREGAKLERRIEEEREEYLSSGILDKQAIELSSFQQWLEFTETWNSNCSIGPGK